MRLELGLQESVRSAVLAGYGVTFISRAAVEAELAAGTLAEARVEGMDGRREISIAIGTGRAQTRVVQAFVTFARERVGSAPETEPAGAARVSAQAPTRVFRFGAGAFEALEEVCAEVGIARPMLVTSGRGAALAGAHAFAGVFDGVASHVPAATVEEATALARAVGADGLVGLGGGSAIDTCKAVVTALAADGADPLPRVVAVPTTYAGAEWTPFFGTLLEPGRKGGGSDERAAPVAAIYDPELTLDLPLEVTRRDLDERARALRGGLLPPGPHAAGRAPRGHGRDRDRPRPAPRRRHARRDLRPDAPARGRLSAPPSRSRSRDSASAHAMAQVLGGRYGLPQGSMNAICLPAAVRFNAEAVPDAVARFGAALGTDDPAARLEELARLGGFERLRDFGIPEAELDDVAAAIVGAPGRAGEPAAGDAPRRRRPPALGLVAVTGTARPRRVGSPTTRGRRTQRPRRRAPRRGGAGAGRRLLRSSRGSRSSSASGAAARRRRPRRGIPSSGRAHSDPAIARGRKRRFATGSAARGGSQYPSAIPSNANGMLPSRSPTTSAANRQAGSAAP